MGTHELLPLGPRTAQWDPLARGALGDPCPPPLDDPGGALGNYGAPGGPEGSRGTWKGFLHHLTILIKAKSRLAVRLGLRQRLFGSSTNTRCRCCDN